MININRPCSEEYVERRELRVRRQWQPDPAQQRGGGNYTLGYDAENRLVSVTGAATATFYYDGDGNRVKGIIGGITTTYIGNYFEWTGSTGTMERYYYAGSTLYYLLGDHLGSLAIT